MKPILYDANETAFTSQGIGVLNDCIECTCDEERNGIFECSLVYPISGQFYSEIKLDRLILVKASNLPTRKLQPFRIYKITKPISGKITVYARHISYELSYILVRPFTADTPSAALSGMTLAANRVKSTDTCPFTFTYDGPSDPVNYNGGQYTADEIASIRSRLGGSEGSLLDIWHGEFEWDVWNVIYHVPERNSIYARGQNRGVVFRYGGNITDMTQESDIGELITRVYPYCHFTINETTGGDDELSSGEVTERSTEQKDIYVELDEKYVDANTINNFSYPRVAMLDLSNELDNDFVEECLDGGAQGMANLKAAMKDIANEYIALQGVANENNQISFIPPDDIVELCDVVTIENEMLGISTTTKIQKVSYNVLLEQYNSIEIGDLKSDFTESISNQVQNNSKEIAERYQSLEVDILKANGVVTDQLNAHTAQIGNLTADNATIKGTLNAHSANIEDLTANKASVQQLEAAEASIGEALIGKADVADLSAANANISNLQSDYANVKSLLAGNAAAGDLQAIHLTTVNSSIDTAVVNELIARYAILNHLVAGDINTDEVRIHSNDGSVVLSGGTQQFFDQDGNVRLQIGKDAQGNFTFVIYGDNNAVLLDETGLHTDGVPNGLIVDRMVKASDGTYKGIGANKLDINSVVEDINNNGRIIKSSNIYFDEQSQSLDQVYSQMSESITTVQDDAAAAMRSAESANEGLQKALDAISGIDTLTALNVWLSNDAHVIHTYSDGTGGDYSDCNTTIHLYLGDTEVTQNADQFFILPSPGVEGTWNATTKTYQVTNMTTDNGYVDIGTRYGMAEAITSFNNKLVLFNNKLVKSKTTGVTVYKRFSISKSPDGKVGSSYRIEADNNVLLRKKDRSLNASSITFSSFKNDNGNVESYKGFFTISESADGTTFVDKYTSSAAESSTTYSPSATAVAVKCALKDDKGALLDEQSVYIIADGQEIRADINKLAGDLAELDGTVETAIQETDTRVSKVESGINGLSVDISNANTRIDGVTNSLDRTILFGVTHKNNNDGTTTCYAHVWRQCKEITKEYKSSWFTWYKYTEEEKILMGDGYEITVNDSDFEFSGVVIGRLTTYTNNNLLGNKTKALAFANKVVSFNAVEL